MGVLWAGTSIPSPNLHCNHIGLEESHQSHQILIEGRRYNREVVSKGVDLGQL